MSHSRRVHDGVIRVHLFFFSSRRRHTRCSRDWSSDVCSSDLPQVKQAIIDGVQKEAANRSVDELNRERDAMLLELLATRAKGEEAAQAAIAGGHGDRKSVV